MTFIYIIINKKRQDIPAAAIYLLMKPPTAVCHFSYRIQLCQHTSYRLQSG